MTETIKGTRPFLFGVAALIALSALHIYLNGKLPSLIYQFISYAIIFFIGFSLQKCTYEVSSSTLSVVVGTIFNRTTVPTVFLRTQDILEVYPYSRASLPRSSKVIRAYIRMHFRKKYALVTAPKGEEKTYIIIAPSKEFINKVNEYINRKEDSIHV